MVRPTPRIRRCAALILALGCLGCAPREVLLPKFGLEPPRLDELPADFDAPISHETGRPMPGFGGGGGGVNRTPVIFVHGNTVSAAYWLPVRAHFLRAGYTADELWALGYGWNNVRYFDANDLSVPSLDRIVNSVMDYLSEQQGRPVQQVDLIGHSLGVTLTRQWLKQTNSWHKVRRFIAACGANDGVWTAWPDSRGQQRPVSWELYPGSPWLAQLNRGGETPGPTRYMTLYDGTGWGDVLFPRPGEHSGALEGAYNLPYNAVHGSWYGHLNLPREPGPMDAMIEWLEQGRQAAAGAARPEIAVSPRRLLPADEASALRCSDDGRYPDASLPGQAEQVLEPGRLYTCYPHDPRSGLAGRMQRFTAFDPADLDGPPPTVTVDPPGGAFEHPQDVRLSSSDPDAFIVYNTSGTPVMSGSPLYTEPVHVAAPLTLTAMAIAPGGRRSEPVRVAFDISLELVEARHSLRRQFEPDAPVNYQGRRKKGN